MEVIESEGLRLPNCNGLRLLAKKTEQPNLIFHLSEFKKKVAQQVAYVKVVFPEYTPSRNTHLVPK